MTLREKKNFIIKFILSRKFLALVGLVVIILISFPLAENISRRHRINQEIKQLEKEIAALENKNLDFKKLVSYLESNQFIEEQARLKLGLKKEGETVAVIEQLVKQGQLATTSTIYNIPGLEKESANTDSNTRKWINYFLENK